MASMPPINDRVMSRRYAQSCPASGLDGRQAPKEAPDFPQPDCKSFLPWPAIMRNSIRPFAKSLLFSATLPMIEFRHLEELMKHVLGISCAVVAYIVGFAATPVVTRAQAEQLPIIDMHLHAYHAEFIGKQPANPVTGEPSKSATDEALQNDSLARLERYNIVRAVTGRPLEVVE